MRIWTEAEGNSDLEGRAAYRFPPPTQHVVDDARVKAVLGRPCLHRLPEQRQPGARFSYRIG